jgi:hypothetical protein
VDHAVDAASSSAAITLATSWTGAVTTGTVCGQSARQAGREVVEHDDAAPEAASARTTCDPM